MNSVFACYKNIKITYDDMFGFVHVCYKMKNIFIKLQKKCP